MAHTINIEELGNALGQYCVKYGKRIHQTLKQELEFEKELPFVDCDYAYQGQDMTVGQVMQPYQKAFTPNNSESFDGVLNILQIGKIDLEFDWEELMKFYSKWRCNWFEAGKPEQDWTYIRYIIDQGILPEFHEELNLSSYNGVYNAPTAGTPGAFLDTFTGYKKWIEDFVTAGELVPLTTGAFTDNTMVDQVRDFCKQLPINYRRRQGILIMSDTNAQRYAEHYQLKYPTREVTEKFQDRQYLRVDHYNKLIVGKKSMEGSNRIICIFPGLDSMLVGTKTGFPMYPNLRFHVYDRTVHVLGEFYRFFGFETLQHMFVNELE